MARIALLSNPRSTGNRAQLPRVRSFCARHPEIFHYEVEHIDQIEAALRTIALVNPRVLVINGGDGTVQATLTALHHGDMFDGAPPPVAVLPNGKTNLIALDLGAEGDPIAALERVMEIAEGPIDKHVVTREMIALSHGEGELADARPVLGMFLGGAGLAETMLYCRHKIYPLGLPNWLSHFLTAMALLVSLLLGLRAAFLPARPAPVKVSLIRQGQIQGSFSLLIVTTLRTLLMGSRTAASGPRPDALQLLVAEQHPLAVIRALIMGRIGYREGRRMAGVHFGRGDEIRIEGDRSQVILDGELFQTGAGAPIVLRQTAPMPFLKLAA